MRILSVVVTGFLFHLPSVFAASCDLPMFAGARLFAAGGGSQYMATGDFNHDGNIDVVVAVSGKNSVAVLLSNGDGTFQPAVNYPVPQPSYLAVADFNSDGKVDLAVSSGSSSIVVLLGNGDGTFKAAITASNQAGAMAVGDFNGDGVPDLALAGAPVYILLGKGDGTFQAPIFNSNNLVAAFGIAVGDFNADGKLDVVTGSSDGIYVLLGDGKGNMSAPVDIATGSPFAPLQVAVGDFNGDHKLDVVTLDPLGGNLYVLLGNGSGGFQAATAYALNNATALATSVLIADLNGDGKPDVAVAMETPLNPFTFINAPGTIAVYSGNGDGTFQTAVQYNPTAQVNFALGVGDFNSDGLPDLVFASTVPDTPTQVGVMFGTATGAFQSPLSYAVGPTPGPPVLADLNGDGKLDMVVASGGFPASTLSVLLGNGDGTFQPAVAYPTAFGAQSVAVGDFNGDGKPDLIVANGSASNLLFFPGNGDGTFQTPRASGSFIGGAVYVVVGDFNKDGKLDVAVVGITGIQIALGNGDGTFRGNLTFYGGSGFGSSQGQVAAADLNGDGNLDLVAANSSVNGSLSIRPGTVSVILGNGDGTFKANVDYTIGKRATGIAIGDLNGDGKPDLAVTDFGSGSVSVLLGNGDGTFQAAVKYAAVVGSNSLVMGDFNGDGYSDLAVASSGGASPNGFVTVMLGNGDGTFRNALTYGAGQNATSMTVGDVNGDGQPDLVITDGVASAEVVLRNSYIPGSGGSACLSVPPLSN